MKNLRTISAKFQGPTNSRSACLKFTDKYVDASERYKTKKFSLSEQSESENIQEFAARILTRSGFKVVSYSWQRDEYNFHCDNWNDDFKEVKDIK